MHDHIGEIHQDPLPATKAFDGDRLDSQLGKILFDSLRDRLDLAVGPARADNKVVGDGSGLAHVDEHQIVRLLLERKTAQEKRLFPGIETRSTRYRDATFLRYKPFFRIYASTCDGTR